MHGELSKCRPVETGANSNDQSGASATGESSARRQRTSLFGHYRSIALDSTTSSNRTPAQLLTQYLDYINAADTTFGAVFAVLKPLFERVLCVPASSAPVERVFSQSGLIMRPNRARMTDKLLEELVFMRCNQ